MKKTRYIVHGTRSFYGFCDEQGNHTCAVHEVGTWCCPRCEHHRCPVCALGCTNCGTNVKEKLAS